MLTYKDCLDLCELTQDEVDAIAAHEHCPDIAAIEMGAYLVRAPGGQPRIRRMIRDHLRAARKRGDLRESARLKLVLQHFIEHCAGEPGPAAAGWTLRAWRRQARTARPSGATAADQAPSPQGDHR